MVFYRKRGDSPPKQQARVAFERKGAINLFNTDTINYISFSLLEGQVDLILRALELYAYNFHYISTKKDELEDLRNSLIYHTYHQILSNYTTCKYNTYTGECIINECKNDAIQNRKRRYYKIKNKYKNIA